MCSEIVESVVVLKLAERSIIWLCVVEYGYDVFGLSKERVVCIIVSATSRSETRRKHNLRTYAGTPVLWLKMSSKVSMEFAYSSFSASSGTRSLILSVHLSLPCEVMRWFGYVVA